MKGITALMIDFSQTSRRYYFFAFLKIKRLTAEFAERG